MHAGSALHEMSTLAVKQHICRASLSRLNLLCSYPDVQSFASIASCCPGNGSLFGVLDKYGPSRNETLGPDMSPLNVLVEPIDSNILHLKISAPGRWEVPQREIFINTGVGES